MVIRGNTRGNGRQLAQYLLTEGGNDQIHILDVDGRANATDAYLHQTLHGMSLSAELTKSQKGLYHAQINPAYAEDRRMTNKDWFRGADILAHELGLSEQRRVIVLHTKKNRTHAHVVFERYDHQTGKVISDSFSRLAQDRARKEMERVFEHAPTPHRNQHRPELKDTLTGLWQQTETGKDFIKAVHENGYLLAEGVPRHPFMVVDENGRSFDLVRQLKGVRIKEVRQRLRDETLIPEKQAIEIMRQKQEGSSDASKAAPQRDTDHEKAICTAAAFWHNKQETTLESEDAQSQRRMKDLADSFIESGQAMMEETKESNGLEQKKIRAGEYFSNADELTNTTEGVAADRNTLNRLANDAELQQDIRIKLQSDVSQERQTRVAEQFATNSADTMQPSVKPDRKRYQEALKNFMQSEEKLVADARPEADQQRQQERAWEFFDNQDALTADRAEHNPELKQLPFLTGRDETKDATFDDELMRKLILEQKEIRERTRQKSRKRSR